MTLLDRYLFRNVLLASLGAVGVFAFVMLVGNVVKDLLGAVASEQISVGTFLRLVLQLVPYVVSYALPMGVLTGILLVLGRLSAQQEITAMRAAGWGITRIGAPVLVLAVLGAAISVGFNTEIGPRAMSGYRLALADAVRTNPLSFIVPREFVRSFPGYVLYVAEKAGSKIRGVWIWQLDKEGRAVQVVRGEEGECRFDEKTEALLIRLVNARVETRPAAAPERFASEGSLANPDFGALPLALPLEQLLGRNTYRRKVSLKTFSELSQEYRLLEANPDRKPADERTRSRMTILYAMHKQFVLAAAVVSFALVGVPLGIKMQRKESSANLGLALVLALGFYFVLIMIDWLQQRPQWRPDLLLWLPNLLFGGLGIWLFWRADRR